MSKDKQEPGKEAKEIEELKAKLAEAEKKLAEKDKPGKEAKPDGIKLTKKAPEGEPGSDGKGNLIKYAPTEEIAKKLKGEGWE